MADKESNMVAVVTELLGPLLQGATIATLLILTYNDTVVTLFAIMASLIWLTVTKGRHADEVTVTRAARDLYVKLGEWLGRDDASDVFDTALAERMQIHQGIEHEDFDGVLLAQNVGNAARGLIIFVVQIYLIVVIVQVVLDSGALAG